MATRKKTKTSTEKEAPARRSPAQSRTASRSLHDPVAFGSGRCAADAYARTAKTAQPGKGGYSFCGVYSTVLPGISARGFPVAVVS